MSLTLAPVGLPARIRRQKPDRDRRGDGGPPPDQGDEQDDPNYCVRVKITRSDGVTFTGLSPEMEDIVNRTTEVCRRGVERGDKSRCADVQVFIIRACEECDGRVIVEPERGPPLTLPRHAPL